MSFRAWKKGFRLVEIPIVFHDRVEGHEQDEQADRPGGDLDGLVAAAAGDPGQDLGDERDSSSTR